MLFNSLDFLLFFPIVCIVYYCLPTVKTRNYFLLIASYYFYMCWEPKYALLLLSSTLITYGAALGIDKYRKHKKVFLALSIVLNLSILFFFKYFNWAAGNVSHLMSLCGIWIDVPEFKVLLPVGISFYIFQALGYTIDVYREDVKSEKNFFVYALFVSFFPQLVAGPIERSTNLLKQFYVKHKFDADRAISGIQLMLWGYFLKLVIADNFALYVNSIYDNLGVHTGDDILLASFLFCFQLYGDFAGYSFIAIGAARVMGFKLMDNFLRPYFFSSSIQEYWRRNHISLTTWFMDYIYYPMVGSSINIYWWCFSIFLTFFISGFWHGASWTYVICFSIFGIYLVACILKEKSQRRFEKKHGLRNKEWWIWVNRALTFVLVMIALVFFRANTIHDGFFVLYKMATDLSLSIFNIILENWFDMLIVFVLFVVEYIIEYKKTKYIEQHYLISSICISLVLILSIFGLGEFGGAQFIYFQF